MKQLTIYLSILTFITGMILGCGKKFDEEKFKALQTTQKMLEAEHQTLASAYQQAQNEQKAMLDAKKLDAATQTEWANLLKQQADILTQHEALVKKYGEMTASYEKKELEAEKADAQDSEMKAEDAKIMDSNKAVEAKLADLKKKAEKPAAPSKTVPAKKKK